MALRRKKGFVGSTPGLKVRSVSCSTYSRRSAKWACFANALDALVPQPNAAPVEAWCEECFPLQPDGSRLTLAYMATIIGRSEAEVEQILFADLPIVGHAWESDLLMTVEISTALTSDAFFIE
jgi:hypothetical protein